MASLWHSLPLRTVLCATYSHTPGFIVVAYGKMGGIEMGYRSDLDLVFLHSGDPSLARLPMVPRSIDSQHVFYPPRSAHYSSALATSTASGMAYEIDMRLRPSGNSGMLVSSLAAFDKVSAVAHAWTWEHQALVRAQCESLGILIWPLSLCPLVRENTPCSKNATRSF